MYDCIVLAHTDSADKKNILLGCIEKLKKQNYRVVVVDHFFVREAFELADVFIHKYQNPILTPVDYKKYKLNHTTETIFKGYKLYNPVNTFAAYSIVELIKEGFNYVDNKALVLNYDWHLTGNLDRYFNINKEAVFFKYADNNSVYTAMFIMQKKLALKLNAFKTIDDYCKNLKYLEWWFYDLFEKDNIVILPDEHLKEFNANLYYRINEKQLDLNFYLLNQKEVLLKNGEDLSIYTKHYKYKIKINENTLVVNLNEDHFDFHYAVKL